MPPGCPLTLCFLPLSHPVTQGLLGIQDLGQVFFEPIKDKQGNILIVTLKEVKTNQTFESVRWVPVCKLQTGRKSVSSPEEPTALDTLLISLQVCPGTAGGAPWETPCSPSAWKGHSRRGAEPSQPPKILVFQGEASSWCQIQPGSTGLSSCAVPFSSWAGCAMAAA